MSDFLIGPTGRRVYFASPFAGLSPAQIVREVATGLSREQRFAGHLRKPYSVLQHSIAVQRMTPDPGESLARARRRIAALFHDGSEAYLRDLPKPVKELLPDYQALEERFQKALFDGLVSPAFSTSQNDDTEIRISDAICQVVEADFLGYGASTYGIDNGVPDVRYLATERVISDVLHDGEVYHTFVDMADGLVRIIRNG